MSGRTESPHVSESKLGRYLTATPALRKQLIDTQKHPPDPRYLRYPDAAHAITDFLCHGQDEAVLRRHQHRLATTVFADAFDARRAESCIEAIDAWRQVHPGLGLGGLVVTEVGQTPPPLQLEGVAVQVRPQVVLQEVDAHGDARVGVLKLYFSKHHPLDERSGQYIATLLEAFCEQHLAPLGPICPKRVLVVDVFAGQAYSAPRARARRLCDVRRACEEIAARWPVH
ncbi:hypothetical protein [Melittangium boletus]|uniref:Uncharacterized protein n=1 Tax=Melittangium boletus DSM 14713 TaxID=1294270 RepID=A0A250ICP0_9BACT|nr:hypothetical protein [Melittangium boletus]ATB29619.1 hypothetical protein MEBOL_003074 [Melittangium boletus DSM 14713]